MTTSIYETLFMWALD